MGNPIELLFILALALLVLGPKRLPEVGRTLGRTLTELKRASNGLKASIEREIRNAQQEAASAANSRKTSEAGSNPDGPKT